MKRFNGGEKVPGGFYWNAKKWDIVSVSGDEGVLEGNRTDRYLYLPLLVMAPVAVVVSFAFVIFLPFIGFALFAWTVAKGAVKAVTRLLGGTAVAVAPGWQPGAAHLTGRPEDGQAGDAGGEAPPEARLSALKEEIDAERRNER